MLSSHPLFFQHTAKGHGIPVQIFIGLFLKLPLYLIAERGLAAVRISRPAYDLL